MKAEIRTETRTSRRAKSKRPVLVTSRAEDATLPKDEQIAVEESQEEAQVEVTEPEKPAKRLPRFFSSVAEKPSDQPKVDPDVARLDRALRGKTGSATPPKESKKSAPAEVKHTAKEYTPKPRSKFKTRWIYGMGLYLVVADFLGVYITNWMVANHLDGQVFKLGSFVATRSTVIFLSILVILLLALAKFDLIPRSLGGFGAADKAGAGNKGKASAPSFESKAAQPVVKQGVKGSDDALYQEYRSNQRYFQKRDRKK